MKKETILKIEKGLQKARTKHKKFACSLHHIVSILTEETGEFAQLVNDTNSVSDSLDNEALDIIAVCVRYLERDE